MYDTIYMQLKNEDAPHTDFLSEVPCFLNDISEHVYNNGVVIGGYVGNLSISVSSHVVKVREGSICKYFLGDNMQTMSRKATGQALQMLSDALHLPMNKAHITRMDIAQNFVMRYPIEAYLCHLGTLQRKTPLKEPNGLYYPLNGGRLCFYDKVREQKKARCAISEVFEGKNVLRYERRFTDKIAHALNKPDITASMLYDEDFYINVLDLWYKQYQAIQKINQTQIDFTQMKSKQDLYRNGILALAQSVGGCNQLIEQVQTAQKKGELSRQTAHNLRQAINDACSCNLALHQSEEIEELNKKMCQAVKYYR